MYTKRRHIYIHTHTKAHIYTYIQVALRPCCGSPAVLYLMHFNTHEWLYISCILTLMCGSTSDAFQHSQLCQKFITYGAQNSGSSIFDAFCTLKIGCISNAF